MNRSPAGLLELVALQHQGVAKGFFSVCSAHPSVIEATLRHAARHEAVALIEATSNQVNPLGGYTGQTPTQFARLVSNLAAALGLPPARVILGGDHLGPYPFRAEGASLAMEKARQTVHDYVLAGYSKIHLDASMPLLGDPAGPLDPATATSRMAELLAVAEAAAAQRTGPPPLYVIGTEVPTPGGETRTDAGPSVTETAAAEETLALARAALDERGLSAAAERVIALVVQPGVEFGDDRIFSYDRGRAAALRRFIEGQAGLVFEAHSTDYQPAAALRQMVEDHFAILKVGPGLTFALREALYGLEAVEREWLGGRRGVELCGLHDTLERVMLERPEHWEPYLRTEDPQEARSLRHFGWSDRIRYYWPHPDVRAAVRRLNANLEQRPAPVSLLSQYLPDAAAALRAGALDNRPSAIVGHRLAAALGVYADACGLS